MDYNHFVFTVCLVGLALTVGALLSDPVLRPRQVVSKALLGAELFYEDH